MAPKRKFSSNLLKMMLAAIICTALYIMYFLYHLYHFDPLHTVQRTSDGDDIQLDNKILNGFLHGMDMDVIRFNTAENKIVSEGDDNQDGIPLSINHMHHNYAGKPPINLVEMEQSMYRDGDSFNISTIVDKPLYSISIQNHYSSLYSNKSLSNLNKNTFYHLKPKCVRQDINNNMCYLADCHDNDSLLHFHAHFPHLMSDVEKEKLHLNDMDIDKNEGSDEKEHVIARLDHHNNANGGNVDPYNNDIDEENAALPNQWYRYRSSNIQTKLPYNHILIREDTIRKQKGAKSTACFISHRHRFVFVHVLKSGGTSMSGFLCYALCNSTTIKQCDANILKKSSCKKIKSSHPEYFYFAIVRNPYNRIFSLWSHQLTMSLEKAKERGNKIVLGESKLKDKISDQQLKNIEEKREKHTQKLDIHSYSRKELLQSFAEFIWQKRFIGTKPKNRRKTGVSSDHNYEQHWWIFNNRESCPIVDFIGHLEHIEYDIHFIINLINDNENIMKYYIENGEYWHINTYGVNIKKMLYNNTKQDIDGFNINSLTDIFKLATNMTGIDCKRWAAELYEFDFKLLGYDINKIEHNLQVYH